MKRRLIHIIWMVSVMAAMLIAMGTIAYADTIDEGTLGDDIIWTLDDEGTLTIGLAEGVESAAMPDFDSGQSCFYNNSDIKTVNINDGITAIGEGSFENCAGITSVTLPDGVTDIRAGAFCRCTSLASINLPNGLQSIGEAVFYQCRLKNIEIPDTVTQIGEGAYRECIYARTLKLPAGLESVPDNIFNALLRLKSVEIPEGVKAIEEDAFEECTQLREITFPKSMEFIGNRAFVYCLSLEKVTFKGDFCLADYAFPLCDFTAYYPLHNATWDEDAIDTGYGGKVKWVGYCNDPQPAEAVQENVVEATVFAAGSYDSVVYCSVCGDEISRTTETIAKLTPTIKLSATKKTLKKKKTYTLKVTDLANGDSVKSFKTSKKSVATVTSKGKITAKKKGKATITVTLKSGKTAKCTVTVK